ncbi:hypothetical protein ABPG77_011341 [Micractinium sp. CCAP 211/92]
MTYRTALVTGASRGIGLGLVRELLAGGATVVATVRSSSNGLSELASEASGRLHIVQLDTASAESIAACVEGLKKEFQHFDLVVNNAGILEEVRPFAEVKEQELVDAFRVNTIGPFLLTQHLLAAGLIGQPGSVVANISSILGSIGTKEFNEFPVYAYRASKAALNSITRFADVALASEGISSVAIHPGYVKTDINKGGGFITVEESAKGIVQVLNSGKDLHGRFYGYDGAELPW